ncbi:MAG TPA: glycosyl hydrolase family 28 protein [Candidatus Acidoferrales bacterium]|nr:glycosyl hydrolase family 28 protein [Candidatus Acidoferrales bacterium]
MRVFCSFVITLALYVQPCAQTYYVRDFGAVGDGKTINTAAIQKAIDSCRENGGGTVVVPTGTFISGTLQLFSNINLHLERGAVLKGSNKVSDYYLHGKRVGLIYTEHANNVSITGEGNIDGSGDSFMDLNKSKRIDGAGTMYTRQGVHFREVSSGLGDGPLVPLDRPFQMIIFSDCRNVTIRNVTISNSPFWTVHLADCDGVVVSGVRIWNNLMIPNNDGIDFTSCSNVQMSDCDIRTGDDGIVTVGYAYHFDLPGYNNLRHVSENITVTNCHIVSRSSAIRVGGWDQNEMRNYTFSNIVIDSSNRGIHLCVRDSGSIRNIMFSNIYIQTRLFTGDWWGNGEPINIEAIRGKEKVPLGNIRGVKFSHVIAEGAAGILLYSSDESEIEDVSFHDVSLTIENDPLGSTCGGNFDLRPVTDQRYSLFKHDIPAFYAQHVRDIRLRDMDIRWGDVRENYFTNGIEFSDFKNIMIEGCTIAPAPHSKNTAAISLENGKGYRIINSFPLFSGMKFLSKRNVETN